jgi:hypothetical protein
MAAFCVQSPNHSIDELTNQLFIFLIPVTFSVSSDEDSVETILRSEKIN